MPRSKPPCRLTFGDAVAAHHRAIGRSGGRRGILDPGRIEVAIARPYNGYNRPTYRKTAALIESIVANHGFVDGNKRTALILTYLLLERSNYQFIQTSTLTYEDDLERLILDITTRYLSLDEASRWLRARIRRTRAP